MDTFLVGRRFARRLLLTLVLMSAVSLVWAAAVGLGPVAVEEGPLESMQELLLLLTAFLMLGSTIYQRGAGRMASFGLMLLAIVFFLRELELPVSGPVTAYLHTDRFRLHETLALLALGLPYLALRWRYIPQFWAYARALQGWPLVLSAGLLLAGAFAESRVPTMSFPQVGLFLEEGFETLAYVVLACLAAKVMGAAYRQSNAVASQAAPLNPSFTLRR